VVERAGGSVEAANRPGGGAIVGFRLPLAEAPAPGGAAAGASQVGSVDVPLEPAPPFRPPTPA
jgi:hypothetical protein